MSKFVLVSDLHSNYPALQAVVDKEGLDKEYFVLGDVMGLLAYPKETLDLVQAVGDVVLAGNHDKAIFEFGEGHVNDSALSKFELHHTLSNLSAEQKEYMGNLPYLDVVQRGDSRTCLCHAYPWPEKASGYEAGNAGVLKKDVTHVASVVSDDYDWVFHGHTHTQYSLDCSQFAGNNDVHFVNPGSLGWDEEYAVVDTESGNVDLKEVTVEADVQAHVQNLLPDDAPHTENWF